MALIELRSISKQYPGGVHDVVALSEITLDLNAGELVGISGPSGSGKSSLLNILGLSDCPTKGSVNFNGQEVSFHDAEELRNLRRSKIGFVFQAFNLLSGLTAQENVALSLILNQTPPRVALAKARELLEELGLSARSNNLPSELSGGEMQRVAVGRAIIHKPELILADEPTGNLDSKAGKVVLELLQLHARSGTLVVMATHSAEALAYCDRVLRLHDGQLI